MNTTINNANTDRPNMIKSLREAMPVINTEEAPKIDLSKTSRDDLSSVARQGLELAQAKLPEIKTEAAPQIDLRSATRKEALSWVGKELMAYSGLGGVAEGSVEAIAQLIKKHSIDWSEIKEHAIKGGAKGASLATLKTVYDTVRHNGAK